MQTPVRFYITQSDDHAVVRSIPVAVRPNADSEDMQANATPQPEVNAVQSLPTEDRLGRVSQLVRAAARRTDLRR